MEKPKGFDSNYDKYRDYLESDEWAKLRSARLIKDNFRCAICGKTDQLHVHHIFYPNEYGDENINDVITLCDVCHGLVEKLKKEGRYKGKWQTFEFRLEADVDLDGQKIDAMLFRELPEGDIRVCFTQTIDDKTYHRVVWTDMVGLRTIKNKYQDAVYTFIEKY